MDYKARNSVPHPWNDDILTNIREPAPFHRSPCRWSPYEMDAPDFSTVFLVLEGAFIESTLTAVRYGIEAPRNCPVRKAFELGEISWPDFWDHKGWILQSEQDMSTRICRSTYIHPSQMNVLTRKKLEKFGDTGPYELILRNLAFFWRVAKSRGVDEATCEKEYREYLALHGHKIARIAA